MLAPNASSRRTWSGKRSTVYEPGVGWRKVRKSKQDRTLSVLTTHEGLERQESAESVSYAACIEYGTRAIPHPQKAYKGGEDSSFAYAIQDGTDSNILVTLGT